MRDDERCQFPDCYSLDELSIHHIVPRSYAYYVLKWGIKEINDVTNGILLCRKHHEPIHKGYERKTPPWNTRWDKEFKEIIIINATQHNLPEIICA